MRSHWLRGLRALPRSGLHCADTFEQKPLKPDADKKAGHIPGDPPDDSIRVYSIALST
jgi:hypothetical protein